ncbi:MAG: hypothetical protein IPP40_15655 [bacterium]|nr:hypothetical protein [bacterium]
MRTTIFKLLLVLATVCFVTSSHAIGLYVGGSVGPAFPTRSFQGSDIEHQQGAADRGLGGQIEFGISDDVFDAYFATRSDEFSGRTEYKDFLIDGEWEAHRVLYGLRLRLTDVLSKDIEPFFGVAVSNGPTEVKARITFNDERLVEHEKTEYAPGTMLEAGANFRLGKTAQVVTSLQLHNFLVPLNKYDIVLPFSDDLSINTGDVRVTYVALNIGL